MNLLNKVTFAFIALIIFLSGLLYGIETGKAVQKIGIVKLLSVKRANRTKNTFHILLNSTERIAFDFEEISPLFNVQKSLSLRPGIQIAYTVNENNEVIGIENVNNQERISPAFYIINQVMSNVFVYLVLLVLTLVQLSYLFYNYSFTKKVPSNDLKKVLGLVDQINQLFKKYIILIPLLFFVLFYLLVKFTQHFDALVEPTSRFEAQKYILNFIMFWFLVLLLSINRIMELKMNKFYE